MGSVGTAVSRKKTTAHPQLGIAGQDLWSRYNNNMTDAIKSINPNYDAFGGKANEPYHKNCALCSAAAVLALKGYDVEAMPRDIVWRGPDSVVDFDWTNYDNFVAPGSYQRWAGGNYTEELINPNKFTGTYKTVARKLEDTMAKWGLHSYAEMKVKWKGGRGSHSIIVYQEKTGTTIIDFQNGRTYHGTEQIRNFMKRVTPSKTALYRMDNAPVNANIQNLDKIVKIKGRK